MEQVTHLVNGYLREELLGSNNEYLYPESLTALFIRFLGNVLLGFDVICEKYKDFISDNGRVLMVDKKKCNETITVGCSYPFERGVYTVSVKYYKTRDHCPIGIISDISLCEKEKWIFDADDTFVYAFYDENLCEHVPSDKYKSNGLQFDVCKGYQNENDNVKLMIDCNQWKLTYFLNDEQIGNPVNITKDIGYHLAVCASYMNRDDDPKFEIVSFEHEL